jgi:hypothetical protein
MVLPFLLHHEFDMANPMGALHEARPVHVRRPAAKLLRLRTILAAAEDL